jgi:hypothetical protein
LADETAGDMARGSAATALLRRPDLWALAWLRLAWRRALPRGRRATAKRRRPIVVSLEPVSADWLYETLVSSSRRRRNSGEQRPNLQIVRASPSQVARLLVGSQPVGTVIVAQLDRWLWELEGCDLLYLRPGLVILQDILPGIGRQPGADGAPAVIRYLDRPLAKFPAISLETLFHEPRRAADHLNRWCGVDLVEPGDFPAACDERYRTALSAFLRLVEQEPLADNPAMLSFPVGGTYATTADGAGSVALGEGWSQPESEYTWSDGPRASLAIRLAANPATRLHLRLDGMLAPGAMSVRVFAGGQLASEIRKGEVPHREQSITLTLPQPSAAPILSIELEFSSTFCPKDAGFGLDERQLGFALRSFTITEETFLTASLRSLIRWRSPKVTLALSMQLPECGFGLGGLLADSGLSGSLITLADAQADRGLWLENGRPIPFPEFAASPRSNGNAAPSGAASAPSVADAPLATGLREIGFAGPLPQLLAELARRGSFLDVIILSTGELFGQTLDALGPVVAAVPKALPDIAVCTDDIGFFDRSFFQHPASHERVIRRFAMAMVDRQLISFTRQIA